MIKRKPHSGIAANIIGHKVYKRSSAFRAWIGMVQAKANAYTSKRSCTEMGQDALHE